MAETSIEFDISQAETFLKEVASRVTDMTPVMDAIGEVLVASTKRRFQEGVGPDGSAWAPNSPTTLARKRSTKPLWGETLQLKEEVSAQPRPDGVSWGSNLIYAAVQQMGAGKGVFGSMANGSPIPWGNIPARPFLGVSEEDTQAIIVSIEGFLDPD